MARKTKYRLSFGVIPLAVSKSLILLTLYNELKNWDNVIRESIEKNVLQYNSTASSKRISTELCIRLKSLDEEERDFYFEADPNDRLVLSWIAVCRTYNFIGTFANTVLLDTFESSRKELTFAHHDFFYEDQIQYYPELANVSEKLRRKRRQVIFRMMEETGFLGKAQEIFPLFPSQSLINLKDTTKQDLKKYVPGSYFF